MRSLVAPSEILRHMEVLDADGQFCGLVTGVAGEEIELAEGHLVGNDHGRIPLEWVDYTWDHKLKLKLTCEEALARRHEVHH